MDLMQGCDEWHDLRTGIITASQVSSIISPKLVVSKKMGDRASDYEMVAQRAMDFVEETYQSWAMQRGNVEEIYAKDLYSKNIAQIKDCGFITNDQWGFVIGFSPDGLVGEDGLVEAKSRCQKYQTETIIKNEMPEEYMLQVQSGLLVSGRNWCDYISYSNGMPMFVKRILPDFKVMAAIEKAAFEFEAKIKENLAAYLENSKDFINTERREFETGEVIKPSDPIQAIGLA